MTRREVVVGVDIAVVVVEETDTAEVAGTAVAAEEEV